VDLDPYLYWILTAIALVIVELLTGTFYLLVLGIERGPIVLTAPVYEALLGSIEIAADTTAIAQGSEPE